MVNNRSYFPGLKKKTFTKGQIINILQIIGVFMSTYLRKILVNLEHWLGAQPVDHDYGVIIN